MKRNWFSALAVLISVSITFPLTIVPTQAQDTRKDEAQRLFLEGMKQLYVTSKSEGINKFQQALALYQQIGDLQGELTALDALTLGYLYTLEHPGKALNYAQQRLVIAQKHNNLDFQVEALNALGSTYGFLGNYKAALATFKQSLTLAPSNQNSTALLGLGDTYTVLGEYRKAIAFYRQVNSQVNNPIYDIQGDMGERESEAYALFRMGDLPAAEKTLLQSLESKEKGWSIDRVIRQIPNLQQESIAASAGVSTNSEYQQALQELNQRTQEFVQKYSQGIPSLLQENNSDLAWADLYNAATLEKLSSTCAVLQRVLAAQNKTTTALEIAERCRGRAFTLALGWTGEY